MWVGFGWTLGLALQAREEKMEVPFADGLASEDVDDSSEREVGAEGDHCF